jgi:hypothetical protein
MFEQTTSFRNHPALSPVFEARGGGDRDPILMKGYAAQLPVPPFFRFSFLPPKFV